MALDTAELTEKPVRKPRRRWARGVDRPQYLRPEDNDRVMMMLVNLMADVSALRDRLDTHEALAEAGQVATAAAIETFELDTTRRAAREAERQAMLKRVLRPIFEEREAALDETRGKVAPDLHDDAS